MTTESKSPSRWSDLVKTKPSRLSKQKQELSKREKSHLSNVQRKPHYSDYVTEQNFDNIRRMFHDLLFLGHLRQTELITIRSWYNEFCDRNKLSYGQMGYISALWTRHNSFRGNNSSSSFLKRKQNEIPS